MSAPLQKIHLVRHGETAWSLSGQHSGRTDLALTERGREEARGLRTALARLAITQVLTSPLLRVLAARWLGLDAAQGRLLQLPTASHSALGYDHGMDEPVILGWGVCVSEGAQ
ncbi:MAG: histidine phosphatase family protein [Betaproteobacteria bacterium]